MRMGFTIIAVVSALAVAAGVWFGFFKRPPADLDIAGIYLTPAKPLADFTLTSASGHLFTRDDFKGKWSFLYFGYTNCPDACPLTLGQLNATDVLLSKSGLDHGIAYVLISVDPGRDTPARLAEYVKFFNVKFSAATGETQELDKLTKPLGVYFAVPENPEDPENYLVDHASAVILINPDANLQALFTTPHNPATIATDFAAIRQRYQAIH